MTTRYARGKRAWGECAKSGRRLLLKDMVRDGYTGLLVDPGWREPALDDPILGIVPFEDLSDGISLRRPTSDLDRLNAGVVSFDASLLGVPTKSTTGDPVPPLWGTASGTRGTVSVT